MYSLTTAAFSKYVKNVRDEWEENASTRKAFTIKNGLAILPEIIGGNGAIKLVFNKNDTTTGEDGKQTGTGAAKSGTLSGTNISGDYWSFVSGTFTADSDAQKMSFTFWDATNECTQGTNSQYAFLRVNDFVIDQIDGVAPNVVVNPFFWNSATDNSLYGNSTANGHIELESDLTTAIITLYGNDPKVSGKIVLRGTAYDDTLLGELSFSMTNFNSGSTIAVAEYGTTGWTIKTVGNPAAVPTMAANFYEVTVEDDYVSQDGHKATWSIAIDTAHLSDVAHTNAVFTVIAKDKKTTTPNSSANSTGSASGTTDATKHNPSYQMDVVPYITNVSTGDMDSGTKKYLRRSASGAFVASVDDTTNANVIIKGFNLNGSKVYLGDSQIETTNGEELSVAKSSLSKSGAIKVIKTVNGANIVSLNNLNDDSKDYNKEPNQFAPNLTDNRYIYMWDTTTTTYSGTEAVMKPVIDTDGNKTGNMMWLYAKNNQYLYANNQQLTTSWAGAIYGGNFAYNTSGSPSWTFLHNMNWSSGVTNYPAYGSVQWAKTFANIGTAVEWNRPRDNINYPRLGLGNLSFGGNTQSYTYNQSVMKRYENIKMLVKGDNSDTLNMVAYFDKADESRSIVFWRFHEGTDISQKTFQQTSASVWSGTSATYTDMSRIVEQTYSYDATRSRTSVGLDTPAGREEITTAKSGADSNYFDMAYDSINDVVYIAYYDEVGGGLKIRYLNAPAAGYYGNWTNSWQTAVEIDMDAAGQFVTMITDNNGNIHLAYYDSTGSYLKYALVTPTVSNNKVTTLSVSKKVLVDTLFTNGMYNSITLKEFGTNDIRPVITSYSISYGGTKYSLRTSWPLTTVANIDAGATADDGYTGKWETVVVVSANAPTQDNTYTETSGTGYAGNIVVGYTASKLEQAVLLLE